MKWQYAIHEWRGTSNFGGVDSTPGLTAMLNDKGSQEWELVAAATLAVPGGQASSFIFKKPELPG